jgi:hypothetical protein
VKTLGPAACGAFWVASANLHRNEASRNCHFLAGLTRPCGRRAAMPSRTHSKP